MDNNDKFRPKISSQVDSLAEQSDEYDNRNGDKEVENRSDDKYRINIYTKVNYLAEQSDEAGNRYVFSYTITLTNIGNIAVQLLSRHWIITDANRDVQEVRGQGVVGEQPVLKPKQSFEYTSGTVLSTQVGTMSGSYQMVAEDGTKFDAPIPQFVLSVPRVLH